MKLFIILCLFLFMQNKVVAGELYTSVQSDSIKMNNGIIVDNNYIADIQVDIFCLIASGFYLTMHYYIKENIAMRIKPIYLWRLKDDHNYFTTNLGLKYDFRNKQKSKTYLIVETGYYNWTFVHNRKEKNIGAFDFQLGIGYQWMPYKKKRIATSIELTYSFSKKRKITFEDGYYYKNINAIDRSSIKVCYLL